MYAVDLLARQEHSEKRLREKLQRKGYEADEIDAAMARLHEKHYLNDEEACRQQFDYLYRESRSSVRQICLKLQQRGFASHHISACIPDDTFDRELAAALRNLRIKYAASADPQKMMASLYRQGVDASISRTAVEEFTVEDEI